MCDIDLAVNRIFVGEDNEKKEECTFVDVTAWNRTAEIASSYLKKGSSCMIEGRLQYQTWVDKTSGEKRSKLSVTAEHLQLLDRRPENESPASGPSARQPGRPPERRDTPPPARTPTGDPELDAEPGDIDF